MFYLLENGKIIDSNDIRHFEEDGYLKTLDTFLEEVKTIGKIKKQSGNVFDLIDWDNDLVRVTWSDGRSFISDCKSVKSDFSDGYYSVEWITAIYKPNEKGNYIKVWEVKEDES